MNVFDGNGAIEVARGERAIIAVPELRREGSRRSGEARIEEAEGLAEAIGIDVDCRKSLPGARTPRPATLLGKGQVEEIAELAKEQGAGLLIVDAALTPIQQKNLEDEAGTKVIDRTGLILEIFGERAATAEGRLQVELAHLDYQAGRLVRSWTHLERQRGGFGFLGGPGETQIEADRRLIRDRMAKIRRELDQVKRTRGAAPRPAPARALAGDRAGRLYQRRKIDPFQSADGRSCVRREPSFRDPGPDDAGHQAARIRQGDPVGHGRIRLRPADRVDRRLPRDAGGGPRGRFAGPRPQHGASGQRSAGRRRRGRAVVARALRKRARRRGSRPGTRSTCSPRTSGNGWSRKRSAARTSCRSPP